MQERLPTLKSWAIKIDKRNYKKSHRGKPPFPYEEYMEAKTELRTIRYAYTEGRFNGTFRQAVTICKPLAEKCYKYEVVEDWNKYALNGCCFRLTVQCKGVFQNSVSRYSEHGNMCDACIKYTNNRMALTVRERYGAEYNSKDYLAVVRNKVVIRNLVDIGKPQGGDRHD